MSFIHRFGLVCAALALLALASCGASTSSGPAAAGTTATDLHAWAAQQSWQSNLGATANGMPAFPAESGPRTPSATGLTQTVAGTDYIQEHFTEPVSNTELKIGPAVDGANSSTAYAMYKYTGLSGKILTRLSVNCMPSNIEMNYYVALADFTHMQWEWFGPISLPEFNINFENTSARFISPLGNVYLVVATHESNSCVHNHSTLTYSDGGGGDGDPQPPGAPTGLIASDGVFTDGIGLTWQGSEAAQWYRVWRKNFEPWSNTNPEWVVIGEAQTPEYFDAGTGPGVHRKYKVQAARAVGNTILYSGFSNVDEGYAAEEQGGDTYTISGVINDGYRAGTTVTLLGAGEGPQTIQLGEGGTFMFDGLHAGPYAVYPYNPNHTFEPGYWGGYVGPNSGNVTLTFTGGPVTNAWRTWGFVYSYSATPANGGQFTFRSGIQVRDRLDGSQDFRSATTNEYGFYAIYENPQGANIVYPWSDGFTYNPAQRVREINGQQVPEPALFRAFPNNAQ